MKKIELIGEDLRKDLGKPIGWNLVVLVEAKEILPLYQSPQCLDYKNPYIREIIPCEKKGNKYYNLRNDEEVFKNKDTLEWPAFTGDVFEYTDGKKFLITRRYRDNQLFYMPTEDVNFTSMCLHKLK